MIELVTRRERSSDGLLSTVTGQSRIGLVQRALSRGVTFSSSSSRDLEFIIKELVITCVANIATEPGIRNV